MTLVAMVLEPVCYHMVRDGILTSISIYSHVRHSTFDSASKTSERGCYTLYVNQD